VNHKKNYELYNNNLVIFVVDNILNAYGGLDGPKFSLEIV
jgi:hypothetical protein